MGWKYCTPPEAAEMLRCHPSKVLRLIHSGKLQATDTSASGGRATYLIAVEEVEAFLKRGSVAPVKEATVPKEKPVRVNRVGFHRRYYA